VISRRALFDELVKIGEDAERHLNEAPAPKPQSSWKRVGSAVARSALGLGAGFGAADYLANVRFPHLFKPGPSGVSNPRKALLMIGLPIGAGLGTMLGDRYRRQMDKEMFGEQGIPQKR